MRAWAEEWKRNHITGLASGISPGDEDVARLLALQLSPNPQWNEADLSNQTDLKKFYDIVNTERWRRFRDKDVGYDLLRVILVLHGFEGGQEKIIPYIQNADLDRLVALSSMFINEQDFYQAANEVEKVALHEILRSTFVDRANDGLFHHWIERLRTVLT